MKKRIGSFMCKIGIHKWGDEYVDAGKDWAFGMGHHAQDCKREGCGYTLRHWPS